MCGNDTILHYRFSGDAEMIGVEALTTFIISTGQCTVIVKFS